MGPNSGTARLAAVAFGILLAATIGAFFLSNRLKSKPPEIEVIRRDTFFSPNGDGVRDKDTVIYAVKFTDRASVDVVDADGVRVRRITEGKQLRKGRRGSVTWNGRDDDGRVVPDGEYRLRFILDEGRALLAPSPLYVDTAPPRPAVVVDGETPIVRPGTRGGLPRPRRRGRHRAGVPRPAHGRHPAPDGAHAARHDRA